MPTTLAVHVTHQVFVNGTVMPVVPGELRRSDKRPHEPRELDLEGVEYFTIHVGDSYWFVGFNEGEAEPGAVDVALGTHRNGEPYNLHPRGVIVDDQFRFVRQGPLLGLSKVYPFNNR
jgi:hypothetical protein